MMKKTVSLLFFLALSLCGLAQEHVVVLTEAGTLQQKVAEAGLEQAESLLHYLDLSRARIVKQGDYVKEDEIPDNGIGQTVRSSVARRSPALFDLQGRRVSGRPQHGLYISGGRKVMVR